MKKLRDQILKFGVVGVVCFFIDYFIYLISNKIMVATGFAASFKYYDLISSFFGFTISVIVNYILSFKFVFERREDMDQKKEFVIFLVLSVIGLFVNEACMFVGYHVIYENISLLQKIMSENFAVNVFFKFAATAVVMVYNFVTRKIFLEKKDR